MFVVYIPWTQPLSTRWKVHKKCILQFLGIMAVNQVHDKTFILEWPGNCALRFKEHLEYKNCATANMLIATALIYIRHLYITMMQLSGVVQIQVCSVIGMVSG